MPDSPSARPTSLNERWWWSGTLWTVGGGAVAWYQWPVIQDGTAIWANWLMVGLGVVLAGFGLVRLWRAWRAQQHADGEPGPTTGPVSDPGPRAGD